jgi:hypothetical protein
MPQVECPQHGEEVGLSGEVGIAQASANRAQPLPDVTLEDGRRVSGRALQLALASLAKLSSNKHQARSPGDRSDSPDRGSRELQMR